MFFSIVVLTSSRYVFTLPCFNTLFAKKFKTKHNLSCLLGADYQNDVCEKFGVWVEKSMYGKKYMGIQRTTFLINETGKILKVWNKVKVPNHANEVLDFLNKTK